MRQWGDRWQVGPKAAQGSRGLAEVEKPGWGPGCSGEEMRASLPQGLALGVQVVLLAWRHRQGLQRVS